MVEKEVGYTREYKMRILVKGRRYVSVAIPYEVIERQAKMRGLTVANFLDSFVAVAEYNNFEGIHYTFKEVEEG